MEAQKFINKDMKIIISHVFSEDNKGDASLLSVLINDIREVFGIATEITILTIDNVEMGHTFEGIPVKYSFMYYALIQKYRILKFLHSFFVMYASLFWAYIYKKTGKNIPLPKSLNTLVLLYKNADLVISVGGGYLRGKKGFGSSILLMLLLHPFKLAKILGKPIISYPQSIGPFGNKFQEYLAKKTLKKIDVLMVRENISYQLLHRLGVIKNVIRVIDSGFLFESSQEKKLRSELGISTNKLIVGITVRKWLDFKDQQKYEISMAEFIDYVINHYNAKIILIPQVTSTHHKDDDREVNERVYSYLQNKNEVILSNDNYTHHQIKTMYSSLDYLVGTRFHSVIFALTAYVPCIAIEYEHKTKGIMTDLGLEKWVVPIEEVESANLIKLFDQLIKNKDKYYSMLKQKLPLYLNEAKKTREILKKFALKLTT